MAGVTHASIVNWEYMEIIRKAADPKCSAHLENAVQTIDSILSSGRLSRPLKALFGLADLRHDEDFASVIEVRCLFRCHTVFFNPFPVATGLVAVQVLASGFRVDPLRRLLRHARQAALRVGDVVLERAPLWRAGAHDRPARWSYC